MLSLKAGIEDLKQAKTLMSEANGIEYGYRGVFCLAVEAPTMEDAVRIAIAEGVPASFADEEMTRLSARLSHSYAGE